MIIILIVILMCLMKILCNINNDNINNNVY